MAKKEYNILVDDESGADINQVAGEIERAHGNILSRMDAVGIIVVSIEEERVGELRGVSGVVVMERE